MSKYSLSLAKRIKHLRREKEWTQDELAKMVGTDARMISQYEKGKTLPSADYIVKMAKIFNVTTDYLLIEEAPLSPYLYDNNIDFDPAEIAKLTVKEQEAIYQIIHALAERRR